MVITLFTLKFGNLIGINFSYCIYNYNSSSFWICNYIFRTHVYVLYVFLIFLFCILYFFVSMFIFFMYLLYFYFTRINLD